MPHVFIIIVRGKSAPVFLFIARYIFLRLTTHRIYDKNRKKIKNKEYYLLLAKLVEALVEASNDDDGDSKA